MATPGSANFHERTYASFDGLKLYYREYDGPGPGALTVLCLPGLTRNARDYADLAAHLSQKYRVLCADLRGRGKSEYAKDPATYVPLTYMRDVTALLTASRTPRAAFIGTSLGGLVSMMTAGLHRQAVAAVVLNDVGPVVEPAGIERIRGYVGKGGAMASWDEACKAVKANNALAFPGYTDADWMAMTRRLCAAQPDGTVRTDYDPAIAVPFAGSDALPQVDLWPLFRCLRGIPALAIRGELSDILSPATLARMAEEVPGLKQVTVPNRGHAPDLGEPESLAAIDGFLAGVSARAGLVERLATRLTGLYHVLRLTAAAAKARRR